MQGEGDRARQYPGHQGGQQGGQAQARGRAGQVGHAAHRVPELIYLEGGGEVGFRDAEEKGDCI